MKNPSQDNKIENRNSNPKKLQLSVFKFKFDTQPKSTAVAQGRSFQQGFQVLDYY